MDATSNRSQFIARSASHDLPVGCSEVQSSKSRDMSGALERQTWLVTSFAILQEVKLRIPISCSVALKRTQVQKRFTFLLGCCPD